MYGCYNVIITTADVINQELEKERQGVSMRKSIWKRGTALFLTACIGAASLAAGCGRGNGDQNKETKTTQSPAAGTETKTETTEKEPGTVQQTDAQTQTASEDKAYGKYEEPVTITVARRTFGTEKIDDYWKDLLLKEYNINVEVILEADASQYDEKVNVAIASGTIPDLMMVSPQHMDTLIKADMTADLTDVMEEYLAPETHRFLMEGTGREALASVTYDGRVRFIPMNVTSLINNAFPLFIRKDWLDNLGLPVPGTIEDFKNAAIAFTKDDPDQNGKDDTYGIALSGKSNLLHDWGGLYGFFPAYGVQPCTWYDYMIFYSEDENGTITWDGEKPEVKEGLQLLADLYQEGAIPKDFPTMDNNKIMEDLNAGKGGMAFGVRGLPYWAIQNTIKNDPNAQWYAMNMPTKDGSEPPIFTFQPVNVAMAVSAECEHPEAIMKMINASYDKGNSESPNFDPKTLEQSVASGEFISVKDPDSEMNENKQLFEALKNKDKSNLNLSLQSQYDEVMEYEETKNPEKWSRWNAVWPEEGHAYYLVFGLNDDSMLKKNVWWKMPSENMIEKLPIYRDLAQETMTKIIAGAEPVSAWDDMVKQWNKLGGDEITQEVRESAK